MSTTQKRAQKPPARDGAMKNRRRETRWAMYLIVPTIALLAVVIGYPVVSAIVMSFQQDGGQLPDRPRLVPVEAGGANRLLDFLLACVREGGRTGPGAEQRRGHGVHPLVRALCGENGRHEQLERVAVVEEDPRPGVCPREKGEDLLYRRRSLPGGHLAVSRR